jgi:hypothetical protein
LQKYKNTLILYFVPQLSVEGYQMQGNEYRKTPYKLPTDKICDFLKNEQYVYDNFLLFTNLPPKDTCPIPKVI